jgi:hypothetical protein
MDPKQVERMIDGVVVRMRGYSMKRMVIQERSSYNGMEKTCLCTNRARAVQFSAQRIPLLVSEIRSAEAHPRFSVDISIFLPLFRAGRNVYGADGLGNSLSLCRELVGDRCS